MIPSGIMRTATFLVLAFALVGCGSPPVVPLISGSVTGSYEGTEFTADNGMAVQGSANALILLGDGNLYCGVETSDAPPTGRTAAIYFEGQLAVGDYNSVLVRIMQNVGSYEAFGSSTGSLTLTEVTDTVVAGEFSYSDTYEGEEYSASGTFEVERCPDVD